MGRIAYRGPDLHLLPALLPEREREAADPGELPARLPRLRARLAGGCRRHAALPARAKHRLRDQPIEVLLHRGILGDPRGGRKADRRQRRPLRLHPHPNRLGDALRRLAGGRSGRLGRASDGPARVPAATDRRRNPLHLNPDVRNRRHGPAHAERCHHGPEHEPVPQLQRGQSIDRQCLRHGSLQPYADRLECAPASTRPTGRYLERWPHESRRASRMAATPPESTICTRTGELPFPARCRRTSPPAATAPSTAPRPHTTNAQSSPGRTTAQGT